MQLALCPALGPQATSKGELSQCNAKEARWPYISFSTQIWSPFVGPSSLATAAESPRLPARSLACSFAPSSGP